VAESSVSAWVVRPAAPGDLGALTALATALGPGMTTLPADRKVLAEKIDGSTETFAGRREPTAAQYLLVLEDAAGGGLLGVAAVYPSVGHPYGFFSYKVSHLVRRSRRLDVQARIEVLTLSNDYTGVTEVGSLAVLPALRGTGAGRLLARSRYMLIGAFPDRFAPRVMAELRGWQDEQGRSPFWDAVGARFFDMEFDAADRLSAVEGAEFIADLMPTHPVYPALLSPEARQAIGRPHRASAPAMAMLLAEDFRYEGNVDVFDAGPQVHAERGRIRTVAESFVAPAGSAGRGGPLLASNQDLAGFRVVPVAGDLDDAARRRLGVSRADPVRCSPDARAGL
jgi:arginine N-succinyltransferase